MGQVEVYEVFSIYPGKVADYLRVNLISILDTSPRVAWVFLKVLLAMCIETLGVFIEAHGGVGKIDIGYNSVGAK